MSGSTFEAGAEGADSNEIVEKSFRVPGVSLRLRTAPKEMGGEFETLAVWLSRDMSFGGAPSAWVGLDTETVRDADGVERTRVGDKIVMLNAARLDSENGIARILDTLTRSHEADFAEATEVVRAAAAEVGIREAAAEARGLLFARAAASVRATYQSTRDKALAAVRELAMLEAASAVEETMMAVGDDAAAEGEKATEDAPPDTDRS